MNQEQFQRLPAYARDAWANLLNENRELRTRLDNLADRSPTRVCVIDHGRAKDVPARYLADNDHVRFTLREGSSIYAYIRRDEGQPPVLEIMADHDRLVAWPMAANVMRFTTER